jgi:hypothetical protein
MDLFSLLQRKSVLSLKDRFSPRRMSRRLKDLSFLLVFLVCILSMGGVGVILGSNLIVVED